MNGRVCSIFSVATVLPSTFSTPIPPLADSAIVPLPNAPRTCVHLGYQHLPLWCEQEGSVYES
jgi:hypothetical protein